MSDDGQIDAAADDSHRSVPTVPIDPPARRGPRAARRVTTGGATIRHDAKTLTTTTIHSAGRRSRDDFRRGSRDRSRDRATARATARATTLARSTLARPTLAPTARATARARTIAGRATVADRSAARVTGPSPAAPLALVLVVFVVERRQRALPRQERVAAAAPGEGAARSRATRRRPAPPFVGGVPKVTSDALFRAHFEQFGAVRSIELTAARSFGFVTFEAPESCDGALRERMHSFRHSQHGTAFIEVRRPNPRRGGGGGGRGASCA